MVRRGMWLTGGVLGTGLVLVWLSHPITHASVATQARGSTSASAPAVDDRGGPVDSDVRAHSFRLPTGQAPAATAAARAVVAQARLQLAYVPDPVDARAFAEAAADWLDPYGLWSVAPDTPIASAFDRRGSELLGDVEGRGSRECTAA